MKVLVTGAAGMLGTALVKRISKDPAHEVVGVTRLDLDLRDSDRLRQFIDGHRPDVLIHAAAKVGGIQANIQSPFEFLAANLSMDTNVIQTCIASEVQNVLYIGSSCMYPKDFRQPLKESDILGAPLEPTNEGYAIAKIAGSRLCEYASTSFGLNYRTLIPSNLYGPGDNFNPKSSHLIASVIRKVHEAKESSFSHIEVWGSGTARREFTYIGDLAGWISENLTRIGTLPNLLNLGLGKDYSINEFYKAAMRVIDYEAPLVHDDTRPEGMRARLMDSTVARERFGWTPEVDIDEGMSRTYEWFLATKETIARL
jgi:GDP-L-fucose synthase